MTTTIETALFVECAACGDELSVELRNNGNHVLQVHPCYHCRTIEFDKGDEHGYERAQDLAFKEGYAEGYETAKEEFEQPIKENNHA